VLCCEHVVSEGESSEEEENGEIEDIERHPRDTPREAAFDLDEPLEGTTEDPNFPIVIEEEEDRELDNTSAEFHTGTSHLFVSNCARHYCHAGQRRAGRFTCTSQLELQSSDGGDSPKELKAKGAGASKRQARHIACARLLAFSFPECQTIVQVKMTTEAARTPLDDILDCTYVLVILFFSPSLYEYNKIILDLSK
jgi:hypothetical protein